MEIHAGNDFQSHAPRLCGWGNTPPRLFGMNIPLYSSYFGVKAMVPGLLRSFDKQKRHQPYRLNAIAHREQAATVWILRSRRKSLPNRWVLVSMTIKHIKQRFFLLFGCRSTGNGWEWIKVLFVPHLCKGIWTKEYATKSLSYPVFFVSEAMGDVIDGVSMVSIPEQSVQPPISLNPLCFNQLTHDQHRPSIPVLFAIGHHAGEEWSTWKWCRRTRHGPVKSGFTDVTLVPRWEARMKWWWSPDGTAMLKHNTSTCLLSLVLVNVHSFCWYMLSCWFSKPAESCVWCKICCWLVFNSPLCSLFLILNMGVSEIKARLIPISYDHFPDSNGLFGGFRNMIYPLVN